MICVNTVLTGADQRLGVAKPVHATGSLIGVTVAGVVRKRDSASADHRTWRTRVAASCGFMVM